MSETNMETLLSPDVQMQLFEKAFDYIKGKHGEVNLQTCLHEMYSEELPEDYVVCVCLACISLIEKGADDFEKIEKGLVKKMKASVMKRVAEHL